MNHYRRALGGLALLAFLTFIGCSDSGRTAVEGSVLIDGQPLSMGSITFIPDAGNGGPSAGGAIVDGKFQIPAKYGPLQGKYRIKVFADRETGRKVIDPSFGEIAERKQIKFVRDEELSAEVGESDNVFSFALTTKK